MADINANPPYQYCERTNSVFGVNSKIGGETKVCDIRGWGYLTGKGHGALGLEKDAAVNIQKTTGKMIADLLNKEFQK